MMKHSQKDLDSLLRNILKEDIGSGDITSEAVLLHDCVSAGKIIAKERMVVAGLIVARMMLKILDRKSDLKILLSDGSIARPRDILAIARGRIITLLKAERSLLNLVQRLSGIATLTRRFVEEVSGTGCTILDTRKTTPILRTLEKYAVRVGGGENHRFGLFDRILIKNNHIKAAGSVLKAYQNCRSAGYSPSEIEIEVRSLKELREVLGAGARRILLDNMKMKDIRHAVDLTGGRAVLEASGNITLINVREIARTGVDYVSVGALTHSARSVDISFVLGR